MRPYLETKVVKVKKPKAKNKYITTAKIDGKLYGFLYFNYSREDRRLVMEEIKKQKEGNWVNGENLDKIKFPCFCSYICNDMKWFGEINKSWKAGYGMTYYLSNINEQKDYSMVEANSSLKKLIENRNIHILKGKIILFEEE